MESKTILLSSPAPIRGLGTIDEDYIRPLSSVRLFKRPGKKIFWENAAIPNWDSPGKGGNRNKMKSKRRKAVLKAHRK